MLMLQLRCKMASLLHLENSMQKALQFVLAVVRMEAAPLMLSTLVVHSTIAHTALVVMEFMAQISPISIILRVLNACLQLLSRTLVACNRCARSVETHPLETISECRVAKLARVSSEGVFVPMPAMPVVGVEAVPSRSTPGIDVSIADCRNVWQMA